MSYFFFSIVTLTTSMKKYFITTVTLVLIGINSFSQTKTGDVFVDVYYGFPDWYKYILSTNYQSNNDINISSTGYIGGRAEYLITRRIGFGLDVYYVKTSLSGSQVESIYNPNTTTNYGYGSYTQNRYEVTQSLSRTAVLGRFVFHVGNSAKVDPYFHAGFGYVNYTNDYSSTSINSNRNNYDNYNNRNSESFFPLGARAGFGMRIFFTENFGANFDLGLGGALFSTGLTYKFFKKAE